MARGTSSSGACPPRGAVRVLELPGGLACRFAGRILADLGAEVLQIGTAGGGTTDPAALALALFLDSGKGRLYSALDDAIAAADVLLVDRSCHEPYPEAVVDYETMATRNPALIVASISAFGENGPWSDFLGSNLVMAHACGEAASLERSTAGDGRMRAPVKAGGHVNDYTTGTQVVIAVLAALHARDVGGSGQHIEISGLEANMSADPVGVGSIATEPGKQKTFGSLSGFLGDRIPCSDGHVNFYVGANESFWTALVAMMGSPEWALELGLRSAQERSRRATEINQRIAGWAAHFSMEEIFELSLQWGCPAGGFFTSDDLLASSQLAFREFFRAAGRGYRSPGGPYRFHRLPLRSPEGAVVHEDRRVDMPSEGSGPLAGLRVLDFSWWWAGPYATQTLAMLGAEVVRVESVKALDGMRFSMAPGSDEGPDDTGLERQPGFHDVNLNKYGIRLDLGREEGREIARRLAARADLVVENFRPGTMERLGLGYGELSATNPRMVMLSVSLAGQHGPQSQGAGFALTFQALGGLGALTGYPDKPPVNVGSSTDIRAGMLASLWAIAGCIGARRSGRGEHIDFSAWESVAYMLGDEILVSQLAGPTTRRGNRDLVGAPQGCYACGGGSGYVAIGVESSEQWKNLCVVMGRPELLEDHRYSTMPLRRRHHDELDEVVVRWTLTRDAWEVTRVLQGVGVPAFPTHNFGDLVASRHIADRRVLAEVDHPVMGTRVVLGPVWRLSRTPARVWRAAPLLGQDTERVLRAVLSIDDDQIRRLGKEGVLR